MPDTDTEGMTLMTKTLRKSPAKPALSAFLYRTPAVDPVPFVAVLLLFIAIAVGASLRPANRAAATDPAACLR